MMFIYAHLLKKVNLIPCFRSYTAILLELRSSIIVNYFYVKERFFYIKSLKSYLGKFTYLLYCRVNGYNFWVDTLQQGMLRFDKLFFAKLSCSQVLLKYVENFMKKICLIKIRASTTSYYIL
ncbi:hypothetical protein NIES4072_42510 [Nostoc commune NIES-4072]|uniref:Uncharacterized protein n=1 Tax=Nostoc commune NIES-4072 TaxID=2005467 RepID=A0A2R5FP67_NOSCO|nr:hypothetical protein NIES4070_48320 [Nostoc commune HK-02]GBG20570.1 hypothetical protein NIES4072_42510 [Nostoc commune NIES-4072]